jgi:uncharacterized protein (TIGR02996 family)
MTPAQRDEELAFARALRADPSDAQLRAVYADWLSDEVGEVERAALVREAERWNVELVGISLFFSESGYPTLYRFSIWTDEWIRFHRSMHAIIKPWQPVARILKEHPRFSIPLDQLGVRPDGSSPDHPDNWAWLLALAVSRGLVLPD